MFERWRYKSICTPSEIELIEWLNQQIDIAQGKWRKYDRDYRGLIYGDFELQIGSLSKEGLESEKAIAKISKAQKTMAEIENEDIKTTRHVEDFWRHLKRLLHNIQSSVWSKQLKAQRDTFVGRLRDLKKVADFEIADKNDAMRTLIADVKQMRKEDLPPIEYHGIVKDEGYWDAVVGSVMKGWVGLLEILSYFEKLIREVMQKLASFR